jgi:hypothetical protein
MLRSGERPHPDQEKDAMLTKYAALGVAIAAIAAALATATPATTGVFNSSDREPPLVMLDPTADNTDNYAFTAPDAPGKVTAAAGRVSLETPAGGPYFGKLDPEARFTSVTNQDLSFVQSYDLYYGQNIGLSNQGGQDDVSGFSSQSF